VTRLCAGQPAYAKTFLHSRSSRLTAISTQPSIQWVPGALSLEVKWSEREADHLPQSSAKAKWECSYSYTLSESLHGVHRDCYLLFTSWIYLHERKFGIFLAVVIDKEILLECHRVWSLWRTFRSREIREHTI